MQSKDFIPFVRIIEVEFLNKLNNFVDDYEKQCGKLIKIVRLFHQDGGKFFKSEDLFEMVKVHVPTEKHEKLRIVCVELFAFITTPPKNKSELNDSKFNFINDNQRNETFKKEMWKQKRYEDEKYSQEELRDMDDVVIQEFLKGRGFKIEDLPQGRDHRFSGFYQLITMRGETLTKPYAGFVKKSDNNDGLNASAKRSRDGMKEENLDIGYEIPADKFITKKEKESILTKRNSLKKLKKEKKFLEEVNRKQRMEIIEFKSKLMERSQTNDNIRNINTPPIANDEVSKTENINMEKESETDNDIIPITVYFEECTRSAVLGDSFQFAKNITSEDLYRKLFIYYGLEVEEYDSFYLEFIKTEMTLYIDGDLKFGDVIDRLDISNKRNWKNPTENTTIISGKSFCEDVVVMDNFEGNSYQERSKFTMSEFERASNIEVKLVPIPLL